MVGQRHAWATAAFIALAPLRAYASSPEDLAAAEKLFEQGQRDMAKGNFAEACPRLAESRRLDPQIGVTLYLADCLQRTGKLATAWGLFRDAAQASGAKNDARGAIAKKRADALEPRLAMLTLTVPPTSEVAGLELLQDDAPVMRARWNVPTPVDSGEHVLTARAAGHVTWTRRFTIDKEGQRLDVEVPALRVEEAPPPAPPATVAAPTSRAEPPPAKGTSTTRILSYALFGTAAASLGVGAIFGAQASSGASDVKLACPAYPQCTRAETERANGINEDARTQATISTIAVGVSVAALAVAVVLLLQR